jgi:hypothetical protein
VTTPRNEAPTLPHAVRVIEEFKKRPGITISSGELIEWTGLNLTQVQTAITRVRARSSVMHEQLQPLISGHMWVYKPSPAHTPPEPPAPPLTALPPAATKPPTNVNASPVVMFSHGNDVATPDDVREPAVHVTTHPRGPEPTLPTETSSFGDGGLPLFEQVGFYGEDALLRDEQGRHWRARPITDK